MHKRNFSLTSGECLNDDAYGVVTFAVKTEGDDLLLLLPEPSDLDAVIGTSKWMVRQAEAEVLHKMEGVEEASAVEIVGPQDEADAGVGNHACAGTS